MTNIQKNILDYWGSFDPAHEGHLGISKIAVKKFKLKKFTGLSPKKNL